MSRRLFLVVACATCLIGCAARPLVAERDSIDSLIAASAKDATQALRDLSESTGNSRVVTSNRPAAAAPAPAPAPAPAQTQLPAAPMAQTNPPVAPPVSAGQAPSTIAGRSGAIAIEMPNAPVIPSPSSGMVASGGLLSAPPVGLEKLVTVRWTGDLEQLIAKVAQEAGWSTPESSGLRIAPVIISISAENRSAFDVLRDIGAIAGTAAEIHVSSVTRTISVRYPQR